MFDQSMWASDFIGGAVAPPHRTPLAPPARVLYVEDDEAIRECLSMVLEDAGFEVDAVGSAEEAAGRLAARKYAIVLSDWSLPGHSGAWLVETARREGTLGRAKAFILTAHTGPVPVDASVPVLRKPVDFDQLIETLRAAAPVDSRPPAFTLYLSDSPASVRAHLNLLRFLDSARSEVRLEVAFRRVDDPWRWDDADRDRVLEVPVLVSASPNGGRLLGDLSDRSLLAAFLLRAG